MLDGFLSRMLLRRPDLVLVMVDIWLRPRERKRAMQKTRFARDRRCVLHMASVEAAASVNDGSLDFVFIDADHAYESVTADLYAWWLKLKPGGLLGGHDYGHPDFPGVAHAVDDFCACMGLTVEQGGQFTWFTKR